MKLSVIEVNEHIISTWKGLQSFTAKFIQNEYQFVLHRTMIVKLIELERDLTNNDLARRDS